MIGQWSSRVNRIAVEFVFFLFLIAWVVLIAAIAVVLARAAGAATPTGPTILQGTVQVDKTFLKRGELIVPKGAKTLQVDALYCRKGPAVEGCDIELTSNGKTTCEYEELTPAYKVVQNRNLGKLRYDSNPISCKGAPKPVQKLAPGAA